MSKNSILNEVFLKPDLEIWHECFEPLAFLTGLFRIPAFDFDPQVSFHEKCVWAIRKSIWHLECLWLPEKVFPPFVQPPDKSELPSIHAVEFNASLPMIDSEKFSSRANLLVVNLGTLHWMAMAEIDIRCLFSSLYGAFNVTSSFVNDVGREGVELTEVNVKESCFFEHSLVFANQLNSVIVNSINTHLNLGFREGLRFRARDHGSPGVLSAGNDVAIKCSPLTKVDVLKKIPTHRAMPFGRNELDAPLVLRRQSPLGFIKGKTRVFNVSHGVAV